MNKVQWKWDRLAAVVCGAVGILAAASAHAQSADGLIDKLVEKGVLSVTEANALREESDKDFSKAYALKNGMPEWVTSFKMNGDFRGRVDQIDSANSLETDRIRYRYRLRLGAVATIKDNFEVGVRFASSDPSGTFNSNPLSANTTLQDNGTRKAIFVDLAYAKWTPIHNGNLTLSGTIGKMDQPFDISSMVFDADYDPEGAAFQAVFKVNDKHSIRLNAAAFALDEINQGAGASHDPYLVGAQALWDAHWTKKFESTLGISAYGLGNPENLGNAAVPNQNDGNTRNAAGNLVYNYNPIVGSAALVYKLDSFPFYKGEFPIKLMGEYMDNPSAPKNNRAYRAGLTLGKLSGKKTWDVSYRYQSMDSDSWYEEILDDDNIVYVQTAKTGGTAGIRGGTNIKGHLITARYAFTDSLNLAFNYYINSLVNQNVVGAKSDSTHMMVDLMWKF